MNGKIKCKRNEYFVIQIAFICYIRAKFMHFYSHPLLFLRLSLDAPDIDSKSKMKFVLFMLLEFYGESDKINDIFHATFFLLHLPLSSYSNFNCR